MRALRAQEYWIVFGFERADWEDDSIGRRDPSQRRGELAGLEKLLSIARIKDFEKMFDDWEADLEVEPMGRAGYMVVPAIRCVEYMTMAGNYWRRAGDDRGWILRGRGRLSRRKRNKMSVRRSIAFSSTWALA